MVPSTPRPCVSCGGNAGVDKFTTTYHSRIDSSRIFSREWGGKFIGVARIFLRDARFFVVALKTQVLTVTANAQNTLQHFQGAAAPLQIPAGAHTEPPLYYWHLGAGRPGLTFRQSFG